MTLYYELLTCPTDLARESILTSFQDEIRKHRRTAPNPKLCYVIHQ